MRCAKAWRGRGYTLSECCVAVAVVAILAAVAAPSFKDGFERRHLLGRVGELSADLQWLRTEAVARRQAVGLTVHEAEGGTCYVLHTGSRDDCRCGRGAATCENGAQALKHVFLPADGPVRLTGHVRSTSFHPTRGNASTMNTFTLTDTHGRAVKLVVSTLGRVRTCATSSLLGLPPC